MTYCSPCKSKPLFSWMYLQFPFFGMQYPSSETSNHASGDIMDNDIWAFGRKCESCSPQFSPFHAYSRVSHKHSHHFKKYFTFKNKWSNRYVKSLKSDANYKFVCQQIKLWFQIPKINKCSFKSYFFWMISYQFIKILSGLKRSNWLLVNLILKSNEIIITICEWEGRFWFSACVLKNDRIRYA